MTVCITGGAGLVGQNLVFELLAAGHTDLTVIDKNPHNLEILRTLHPQVTAILADIAEPGDWQQQLAAATVLVCLHAQIGGLQAEEFERNNVVASKRVCDALTDNPDCYVVHVSSSVLDSAADDFYTRSKRQQEAIFTELPNALCVLRPTLMFGWFDRKHLGWLSRFLQSSPVFPIPGTGRYLRQPLYVRDFCRIIIQCMTAKISARTFSISGKEKITYIDMIRAIRKATGSRALLLKLPYSVFYALLSVYALFDRNPPFTTKQLQALVIDELFPEIDWEAEFGIQATPFEQAVEQTFQHPEYSSVVLQF